MFPALKQESGRFAFEALEDTPTPSGTQLPSQLPTKTDTKASAKTGLQLEDLIHQVR